METFTGKKPSKRAEMPPEQRLLVDRRNAAQYLSISQRSLDYLLANSELNTRRIGTRVLIPISELQRFCADRPPEADRQLTMLDVRLEQSLIDSWSGTQLKDAQNRDLPILNGAGSSWVQQPSILSANLEPNTRFFRRNTQRYDAVRLCATYAVRAHK
jgi:hypothetical protein